MTPKISIITVTYSPLGESRLPLLCRAIDSLQAQTSKDFEWIIVNDGEDPETRSLISNSSFNFSYQYLDLPHPTQGFGLSCGRNRALIMAEGNIVTYLDDDNTFEPSFVAETIAFFERHPQIDYAMPIQRRRRNIIRDGVMIEGKEFYSPTIDCTVEDLIAHTQLIDSNGFAHRQDNSVLNIDLFWHPELRIYIDYEFFLKCVSSFGRERFAIDPVTIVNYNQTNLGIIGRSNYGAWADELQWILERKTKYPAIDLAPLVPLIDRYRSKENKSISAFK
jgi:glycosyltransferase involved in cell wall biosynthesis